jgi:DNA-binding transcriptional MerR regulator
MHVILFLVKHIDLPPQGTSGASALICRYGVAVKRHFAIPSQEPTNRAIILESCDMIDMQRRKCEMFTTGKVAKQLRIDRDTVKNWIRRAELSDLFSPSARGDESELQRRLTESDLFVLNTIRILRAQNREWSEIADTIRAGHISRELPFEAAVDLGATTRAQIEHALTTTSERDTALAKVSDLETEIRQLRDTLDRERKASDQKLRELENKLHELEKTKAVADALAAQELELWRSGRLKPSRT